MNIGWIDEEIQVNDNEKAYITFLNNTGHETNVKKCNLEYKTLVHHPHK